MLIWHIEPVVDLEILRGSFSLTKMPAQLQLAKDQKKNNNKRSSPILLVISHAQKQV